MIVAVVTVTTVEDETLVTVDVGVGMLRQSQALEMAEEATDVSQVGIGGLALRWMISGTASALTSTGPRRTLAGAVVAGGFPGSKMTEVLPLISIESWMVRWRLRHSRSCPASYSGRSGRSAGEVSGIWEASLWACMGIHLVVFTTETVVLVVGCMPRKDEQNGVALCSLSTSMTKTTSEHCCGVRFRASIPLLGEARTALAANPSAPTIEREARMTKETG